MMPIDTGSDFFPEASRDGETVYTRPAGDLNVESVPRAKTVFSRLISDHQPTRFVIDLRDVAFIDSAGLAALVMARKLLPADGQLVLRDTAAPVRGLLRIAQLDQIFVFEETAAN